MLKPGDDAPDFRLPGDDGKEIALAGLRGRPVVLYFFPKALTPGWTTEASEFRDAKAKLDEAGAVILGCSADSVEMQAKFKAKHKINFALLSDPGFKVIEAYGARRMKSFLGKSFLGIVRTSFLIGPDGKIARVWEKVNPKGHVAQVLEALGSLTGKASGARAHFL